VKIVSQYCSGGFTTETFKLSRTHRAQVVAFPATVGGDEFIFADEKASCTRRKAADHARDDETVATIAKKRVQKNWIWFQVRSRHAIFYPQDHADAMDYFNRRWALGFESEFSA